MTTVAPRRGFGPGRGAADAVARAGGRITPGGVITSGVAVAIVALAFAARSGEAIGANSRAQVLLVVAGAALVAAALVVPARLVTWPGLPSLIAFGLLTVLTGLSIIWSLSPDQSWLEANRTFSYLAAFAGGMALVRLAPRRWDAMLRGVVIASVALSAYSLITKAFPEVFVPDETFARLREPFEYWNAVGLMAASGVPPLLWLAARRSGHAAVNALAYPGLGVVLLCLMQAYSRGAILALLVGLAVWFSAVPLRLRAVVPLLISGAAAGLVVAWSFSQGALTEDLQPLTLKATAGHQFGILLLLMIVVLLAAGLLIGFLTAQHPPTERTRRATGRAIGAVFALALAAGVIALATAPGGISGQLDTAYKSLTSPSAEAPDNGPGRLTAVSSVRARYWKEAFDVHAVSPWIGTGAGAYAEVRKRFRESGLDVQEAHGYVVQTLADLGWLGLAVSLAALAVWLATACAVTGMRRRDRGLDWDAERVAMVTLVSVVVVFGAHSFVDWTWFVPANAVLAMVCAGWVVGRAPLRRRLAEEGPTGMVRAAERIGMVPSRPRFSFTEIAARWRPTPVGMLAGLLVLATGAITAWAIVQPLRAVNAGDAALNRVDAGDTRNAIAIARIAIKRNPLALEPRWQLASALSLAGDSAGADAALRGAVEVQPANAEAWRRLGRYRLGDPATVNTALRPFQAAYFLDPKNPDSESDLIRLSRAIQAVRQAKADAEAAAKAAAEAKKQDKEKQP